MARPTATPPPPEAGMRVPGIRMTRRATSLRDVSDQPNSHAAGAVIGSEMVSIIGPHIVRGAEPRAPAKLMLGAIAVRAGRSVDRRVVVIRIPAILGPLKHVAQHVVETKRVG